VNLSADPKDNPILAIALNGGAKYIVSRDKPHVLALGKVRGVRILTVGEFLKLLV
jgi:predicted nucleic acid-binding protein